MQLAQSSGSLNFLYDEPDIFVIKKILLIKLACSD